MLKSNNPRIEKIIGDLPYKNVEYTLPADFEVLDEAVPGDENEREILNKIQENIRFVIDTQHIDNLPPEVKEKVNILASPLECGRVLEMDHEVSFNEEKYIITMKGGGATTYGVRFGGEYISNKCDLDWQKQNQELKRKRYETRFDTGLLHVGHAAREAELTIKFSKLGAYCQEVIGIYLLKAIYTPEGQKKLIVDLKKDGEMDARIYPAILVRAMRTNFRILDLFNLNGLDAGENFENLLNYLSRKDANLRQYFFRVIRNFVRSELLLIVNGFQSTNINWLIHARNISADGEEIDLEAINTLDKIEDVYPSWARVAILFELLVGKKCENFSQNEVSDYIFEEIYQVIENSNLNRCSQIKLKMILRKQWLEARRRMQWELKQKSTKN